jgi:5'-methylthioinosine phosphorylase
VFGIIGGTGLSTLANLEVSERQVAQTPYGEPSGPLTFGRVAGKEVLFLARHGYGHTIPPHLVNYRANVWALKNQGATAIVSIASVGGIRSDLGPGSIVIPHQIIDYTWGREHTFFEPGGPVTHVDFTEPYSETLRRQIVAAAEACGEPVGKAAVYASTQGPRLETAAEIDRLERDGADIVGMTGMPEAALAREIEIDYAAIAVVVNHAAGRGDSRHAIQFDAIEGALQEAMVRVRRLIERVVAA